MRPGNKFIILIAIVVIIILGFGILFFESPKKADPFETGSIMTESFVVDWSIKQNSLIKLSEFASKSSNFEKTILFETPNLKEITFSLTWIDDKATIFGIFGLDTLTLEITTPDGKNLIESAKSAKKTKQGNIEITIPINSFKPIALTLESENIFEARKQLHEKYFDYTWINEEFIIKVSAQIGEIRPLKRLLDKGNDFDLEIIYSYYHASLTGDDAKHTEKNGDNTYKETGTIPPSMCPRCKDYSHFRHRPSCPHYESPFACHWCGEEFGHRPSCPHYESPFACHWCGEEFGHRPSCPHYDDPWDDC